MNYRKHQVYHVVSHTMVTFLPFFFSLSSDLVSEHWAYQIFLAALNLSVSHNLILNCLLKTQFSFTSMLLFSCVKTCRTVQQPAFTLRFCHYVFNCERWQPQINRYLAPRKNVIKLADSSKGWHRVCKGHEKSWPVLMPSRATQTWFLVATISAAYYT